MDKTERTVFANLEAQSKLINQTFREMGVCITAFLEGRKEDLHKSVAKIRTFEKEASILRRKNLEIVATTVSIYRSDLFRLVMKMSDVMANQAGASIRLSEIQFHPPSGDPMIPKIKQLIALFIEMGDELRNLILKLQEDLEKAHQVCDKIDDIEDRVDEIYRELHGHIYNRYEIDLRVVMQLLSFFKHVEEACDQIDSVSDSVRIILATK